MLEFSLCRIKVAMLTAIIGVDLICKGWGDKSLAVKLQDLNIRNVLNTGIFPHTVIASVVYIKDGTIT
jgi:hypothetical protein